MPETAQPPRIELRDYQIAAFSAIARGFEDDSRHSQLLVLPTGCGKTIVFGTVARWVIEDLGGRVLVLAHRGELLTQAGNQLAHLGIEAATEKAEQNARVALWGDPTCVVASVQTMRGDRLKSWPKDYFKLIITDEAHHAPSDSYRAIYEHFSDAWHLGVTATADRLDGENLGQVYESIAYEYSLREAIGAGHLSRLKVVRCETSVDLSNIRTTGGDMNQGDLEEAIKPYIEELANAVKKEIGHRRTIVFTPDVGSAEAFASALTSIGISAESISGKSTDRDEILSGFRHGRFRVLCNCALLTEGFDAPFVSAIVLARPTKSRALYAQMCLDDQTEILTERGWVSPDTISNDDRAAAFDLSDGSIRWSPILSRIDRRLQPTESMFGIASPSLDIRLTDQHRMVRREITCRAKSRGKWGFIEAEHLSEIKGQFEIPVSGIEAVPGLDLTDSQIRFIGWFLTDGNLHKTTNAITISQDHKSPFLDDIRRCIEGCGFKYSTYTETRKTQFSDQSTILKFVVSKGTPRGRDKHLSGWGKLEPYIDKAFAATLDGLNRVQLGVLIDEMNKGDGLKRTSVDWRAQTTSICTGVRSLADRLQSLCVRRGFRCNIAEGDWNANPIYILHIKDEQARYVGGCNWADRPHFAARVFAPFERVWCVEVDTGAIVTRRNGKVAIVGNCGRGTRRFETKDDCLIVDFAWLTGRHKLISLVELFDTTRTPGETQDIARDLIESGKSSDILAAIEMAEEVQQERQKMRIRIHERPANYRRVSYDPMAVFDVLGTAIRGESDTSQIVKATPGQVETLKRFKVDGAEVMSKRRASMMIDTLIGRAKQGLASHKQMAWLIRDGYEPDEVRRMTIGEASLILDQMFGNKGKRASYDQ